MTSRSVCVGLASPSPSAARASIWPSVMATKKHTCKTCERLAANPCPSSGGLHADSVAADERNLLLKPISCSCRQRLAGLLGAPTASRKPQRAAFGRLENTLGAPRAPGTRIPARPIDFSGGVASYALDAENAERLWEVGLKLIA